MSSRHEFGSGYQGHQENAGRNYQSRPSMGAQPNHFYRSMYGLQQRYNVEDVEMRPPAAESGPNQLPQSRPLPSLPSRPERSIPESRHNVETRPLVSQPRPSHDFMRSAAYSQDVEMRPPAAESGSNQLPQSRPLPSLPSRPERSIPESRHNVETRPSVPQPGASHDFMRSAAYSQDVEMGPPAAESGPNQLPQSRPLPSLPLRPERSIPESRHNVETRPSVPQPGASHDFMRGWHGSRGIDVRPPAMREPGPSNPSRRELPIPQRTDGALSPLRPIQSPMPQISLYSDNTPTPPPPYKHTPSDTSGQSPRSPRESRQSPGGPEGQGSTPRLEVGPSSSAPVERVHVMQTIPEEHEARRREHVPQEGALKENLIRLTSRLEHLKSEKTNLERDMRTLKEEIRVGEAMIRQRQSYLDKWRRAASIKSHYDHLRAVSISQNISVPERAKAEEEMQELLRRHGVTKNMVQNNGMNSIMGSIATYESEITVATNRCIDRKNSLTAIERGLNDIKIQIISLQAEQEQIRRQMPRQGRSEGRASRR